MMERQTFRVETECDSCDGTGIYRGMAEGDGVGVVCRKCNGTGKHIFKHHYTEFTGKKRRKDVERVYLPSRFKLGLGVIDFKDIGEIDMDKQGVSYDEFCKGERPTYIKEIECPMMADQGACHKVEGFVDECNNLGLRFGMIISGCKNHCNRKSCWERFEK
jgi:hypothetical protein